MPGKKKHGKSKHGDTESRKSPALLQHVDDLVESLRSLTPAAIREGQIDAVHHSRVATRRLKAAFDLLKPLAPEAHIGKFAKSLKKLRRLLGPLRDLDVMAAHIDELIATPGAAAQHGATLSWLHAQLADRRIAAANEIREASPPAKVLSKLGVWWGLREELTDACDKARGPLIDSLRTQLAEFSKSAGLLATRTPETRLDPHTIRIAGKALRYTLEMARANGSALDERVFKSFKRMQDLLGLWHDYVVLTETMLAIGSEEELALHDASAQRGVLSLASLTLKRAETELGKFAKLWEKEGQPLNDAIHTAVNNTAILADSINPPDEAPEKTTSPKADPDLPGSEEIPPTALPPADVPPPT